MIDNRNKVCPVERAGMLESRLRRWLQDPAKILGPYVREGMTVLDVGCGPGFFSVEMAGMVGAEGRVIAADLQEGMLERFRARIRGTGLEPRIKLVQCGRNDLNVSDKIDFALAFFMVHEVPDKDRFFRQLKALLKEEGRILIVEPIPFHVSKADFAETLGLAVNAGFAAEKGPSLFLCHSAVLKHPAGRN